MKRLVNARSPSVGIALAFWLILAPATVGMAQDSVLGAPFKAQKPNATPPASTVSAGVFTIECEFEDYKLDYSKPGKRTRAGRDLRLYTIDETRKAVYVFTRRDGVKHTGKLNLHSISGDDISFGRWERTNAGDHIVTTIKLDRRSGVYVQIREMIHVWRYTAREGSCRKAALLSVPEQKF